ncbi:hypothetical protein HID58_038322 [Brassica napus]|uniref:Uncharacterized protein n=1 Tax=Brassica napus TaxID=3708 RepID=A0ABQ8BNV2_BRANA|nr:hypothetical protein HID58_038322 [Brassica napus]
MMMFRKVQLSQKKPWRKRSQKASNSKEPGGLWMIRRWTPMIIVAQPPEKKCTNRKETSDREEEESSSNQLCQSENIPASQGLRKFKKRLRSPPSEEVKSLKQLHKMENKENTVVAAGAGEEIQV